MPDPYLAAIGRWLGPQGWPTSFLSIDLETNGLGIGDPCVLPVEIGWALVEDGEVVLNDGVTLDWFLELNEDEGLDFAGRLAKTWDSMSSQGFRYPFTPTYLEAHGVPPRDAIALVAAKLATAVAEGLPIVGHNILAFDRPVLERVARDWAGIPLVLPVASIFDTLPFFRATRKRKPPVPCGTREEWCKGLIRGPEKCSLQATCAPHFGIAVDPTQSHDAAYDALLVAQVLLAMRRAAED